MSSENESDRAAAARLWNTPQPGALHPALFSTISPDGAPHTTWMGSARNDEKDIILTITSPDSQKVVNVKANPKVEWLITSPDRKELLYLNGRAEVVADVPEIKRCWRAIPEKGKAFFLRYYNSGIGFSVIKTKVESAVFVIPEEYRKTRFAIEDLVP